jgi:DNA-directed RNA polymerase subunit F
MNLLASQTFNYAWDILDIWPTTPIQLRETFIVFETRRTMLKYKSMSNDELPHILASAGAELL